MKTQFIDFSSSYIVFRIDTSKVIPKSVSHPPPLSINNVRINHECFATLIDKETDRSESFYLGANCKTERVGVEKDIWTKPNADFVPIFSASHYLILKTFEHTQVEVPLHPPTLGMQPIRQHSLITENFSDVKQIQKIMEGKVIDDIDSIIDLTLNGENLNALTKIENDRYIFNMQYPIKTMNVNEVEKIMQTDTGPILFPDLSKEFENILKHIQLAYVAWNRKDYAEFIVRKEKAINEQVSVFHYCETHQLQVENYIISPL